MKVYKCDICGEYCNKALGIIGVFMPYTKMKYTHIASGCADCCEDCYNMIMEHIQKLVLDGWLREDG